MEVHHIKCTSNYYQDVVTGNKKAELRYNDRDYEVGDMLILSEINVIKLTHWEQIENFFYKLSKAIGMLETNILDNPTYEFTGRKSKYIVTHIVKNYSGLKRNYIMMSIKPIVDDAGEFRS